MVRPSKAKRREIGKFGAVSFSSTLLDYLIFNLLTILGLPLIASNIVSTTLSSYLSYTLNKKVVFSGKKHGEARTVLLYVATLFVSAVVIQSIVLALLGHGVMQNFVAGFGLQGRTLEIVSNNLSKVAAGACTFVWNYFTQRRYVFVSNTTQNR